MKITRLKEFLNDCNIRFVFITPIQSTHSLRNCNRSFERKDNFSLSFALLKSKKIKGIDSPKFSVNLKHNLSQVFYRSFKDKFWSLKDRSAIYNCSLSTLLIKTCLAHMMKLRYYSATSIRTQVREFASVCKGASKVIGYPYPQNNRCHISLIYYSSGLEFIIAKSLFTF